MLCDSRMKGEEFGELDGSLFFSFSFLYLVKKWIMPAGMEIIV